MSAEGSTGGGARGEVEVTEPSSAQRAFARGVAESKATIPHVYFELALERRAGLASIVRASARALRDLPLLNGAYRDGRFERYSHINIAVGVDSAGTLAFPVLRDAEELAEEAVETAIADLERAARDGSLASPAYAGATFTIIDMSERAQKFTPVINHGQAATLGCGSAGLTLACDNRIVQGAEGADLLGRIASMLPG